MHVSEALQRYWDTQDQPKNSPFSVTKAKHFKPMLKVVLDKLGYRPLMIVTYTGPQQRFWGDNQGGWPSRLVATKDDPRRRLAAVDTDPYREQVISHLYWCPTEVQRDQLQMDSLRILGEQNETLRRSHIECRPDDVDEVVRFVAQNLNICIFTDEECAMRVELELSTQIKKAGQNKTRGRGAGVRR